MRLLIHPQIHQMNSCRDNRTTGGFPLKNRSQVQRTAIIRLLILTMLVSCTMASAFNAVPVSAQSPCEWTEYGSNPVFGQWLPGGGAKAYYPKVIYDANRFSGHGDNAYYKMWFGSSNR